MLLEVSLSRTFGQVLLSTSYSCVLSHHCVVGDRLLHFVLYIYSSCFYERGLWLRLITEYCVHSWPEKSQHLAIMVIFSEHLLFINSVYFTLICHSYAQITLSTGLERWEPNRWRKQIRLAVFTTYRIASFCMLTYLEGFSYICNHYMHNLDVLKAT